MSQQLFLPLFALFITFAMPVTSATSAVGADFQKGVITYNNGDYATAQREFARTTKLRLDSMRISNNNLLIN